MSKEQYLVICRQNVGRSQMGEGILKDLVGETSNICITSAGLDTSEMIEKYSGRPHPQVIFVLNEIGIDISLQRISQVTPELLQDSKLIVLLTEESELPDYFRDFGDKIIIMPVEDPAPGTIADVDLEKLRFTRDQIWDYMSQIQLSYL